MKAIRTEKRRKVPPKEYVRVEIFSLIYNRETGRTDRMSKIQGLQIQGKKAKDIPCIINCIEKSIKEAV